MRERSAWHPGRPLAIFPRGHPHIGDVANSFQLDRRKHATLDLTTDDYPVQRVAKQIMRTTEIA